MNFVCVKVLYLWDKFTFIELWSAFVGLNTNHIQNIVVENVSI